MYLGIGEFANSGISQCGIIRRVVAGSPLRIYACTRADSLIPAFPFPIHNHVYDNGFESFFSSSSDSVFFFSIALFPIMSYNANDANVNPAVPCSGVEETSQIADVNAASNTRMTDIDIGRRVRSWSVAEYKTRHADTLDARWFGAKFSD